MREELERKLMEKYSYLFSEYDENKRRMQEHTKNYSAMRQAKETGNTQELDKLILKQKEIGSYSSIIFGCQCNDGWYDLLDELFGKIQELDTGRRVRLNTIKEKFGGLRVYIGGEVVLDIIPVGSFRETTDDEFEKIHALIHEYEAKSFDVCEVCGKPGTICEDHSWLKTVCKEHRTWSPWPGEKSNYKPCQWYRTGSTLIVDQEYTATVETALFSEEEDDWVYTMSNGSSFFQTKGNLRRLPMNGICEGWYVTVVGSPGVWVIKDKEFSVKEGWLYDISNENTTLYDQQENDLTLVRYPDGRIKSVEDKNADETGPGHTK